MGTDESSGETIPIGSHEVESVPDVVELKEETSAPLIEQIHELWVSISVPFKVCRRGQQWSLGVVVLSYALYIVTSVGWPRGEYTPISQHCGPDHPQWTEDVTYRRRTADGGYQKGDVIFPLNATWTYGVYVRGCPCKVKTCVRKCCPKYEMYRSRENLTCTSVGNISNIFYELEKHVYYSKAIPDYQTEFRRSDLRLATVRQNDFKVIYGFSDCGKYIGTFGARYEVEPKEVSLMEDGTALTEDGLLLDIDDYCMEQLQEDHEVITVRCVKIKPLHHPRFWVVDARPTSELVAIVLSYGGLLAVIFVFLFVPQLRNIHGALLIGLAFFMGVNFSQYLFDLHTLSDNLAYLWQFSYLAMFCWLTTFGLDLWMFFCEEVTPRSPMRTAQCLGYATGLPALLTLLTWLVGVVPDLSDSCPRPRFLDDPCTFTVERTSLLFLHLPVGVMVVLNLLLYMSNSFNLYRVLQDSSGKPFLLSPCGRSHDTTRQGLRLYAKVFWTMIFSGTCLLLLTTPSIHKCSFFLHHISLLFYYQGFLLFLVIICDRRFFKLFYARSLEIHIKMQINKQKRKEKKALKEKEDYEKYQQKKQPKNKTKESSA